MFGTKNSKQNRFLQKTIEYKINRVQNIRIETSKQKYNHVKSVLTVCLLAVCNELVLHYIKQARCN